MAGWIGRAIAKLGGTPRTDPFMHDLDVRLRALDDRLRSEMTEVAVAANWERVAPVTVEQLRTAPQHELERRFRLQAAYWGMADHVGLCRTIGGRLIFVDTRDFALSPHLMTTGYWELWITQAMARVLRPGMAVADVGANLGYYTVLMAEAVGPEGRVFAFEPNPAIAELLRRTVSVNGYAGYTDIDARPASDRSGQTVQFRVPAGHPMNASIVYDAPQAVDLIEATTVALDDVLPARVDFLKIDVEGAEYQTWRGLSKTIAANPEIAIFMEVNATRLIDGVSQFVRDIEAEGFTLRYVDTDSHLKPCNEAYIVAQAPNDVVLMLQRGPGAILA